MIKSLNLLRNTFSINKTLEGLLIDFRRFKKDADNILATHESSKTRSIKIEETYKKLEFLTDRQKQSLGESLRCIENELYRASHVLAWAAYIDYLEERLLEKAFPDKDETWLRENYTDHRIIEQCRVNGLIMKQEEPSVKGLLSVRNECAHPTGFFPDLNESLGYVSAIITRILALNNRVTL